MSFADPLALLTLLALPLGIAAIALYRRRRPPRSVPFPDIDLVGGAAPRPRRRRHLALALLLLALAGFGVALARPSVPGSVTDRRATIMLVIDTSGSMAAADVQPYRLRAVQDAAEAFAAKVPADDQVGLVSFSGTPILQVPATADRGLLDRAIENLVPDGATAIGDALLTALQAIHSTQPNLTTYPSARILLLSDGANTTGTEPSVAAEAARRARVPVYTVALGNLQAALPNGQPVPPDPEALRGIAEVTGGATFHIQDAGALSAVYSHLGQVFGQRAVRTEVTAWPVGIGALLLALAVVAAWRFGVRVP